MDLNTLIDELEKARGWLGGGNPDVRVDSWDIALTKVRNGVIEIVLDDSSALSRRAEQEAADVVSDAEDEAETRQRAVDRNIEDARYALQKALDELEDL